MQSNQPKTDEPWKLADFVQPNQLFSTSDPKIQQDILRMIIQYLQDLSFNCSTMTIMDEANLKTFARLEFQLEVKRMKKAILEGDWAEVDRLCARPFMRNHKSFLYAAYSKIDNVDMSSSTWNTLNTTKFKKLLPI